MNRMTADMDPFREIRPYYDAEVPEVLGRVLADPEVHGLVARLRFPRLAGPLGCLLRPLVAWRLRRGMAGVDTVAAFQMRIEDYVTHMLKQTASGLTVTGLERLEPQCAYLFLSNHRDITLDPALVNYALHRDGRDTVRIAIGDNLLQRDYASDLMRLNKSFIVKRSAKGPRQMLAALRQLAAYVQQSVCEDRVSVWLAQREGRAKDGWDQTEPAIIKMLSMSMAKGGQFSDHIRSLRIVPVAISYELDPCDAAKACELYEIDNNGSYSKSENEDLLSIGAGISGAKGMVSVAFGEALDGDYEDPEAVAAAIDRQVVSNYRIPQTSLFAWRAVHGEYPAEFTVDDPGGEFEQQFLARIAAMPELHRPYALRMYLNPVLNRREL